MFYPGEERTGLYTTKLGREKIMVVQINIVLFSLWLYVSSQTLTTRSSWLVNTKHEFCAGMEAF